MRNVFDRLRDELQQLREAEQPDFEDAELMDTDEFGNVTGYEPTEKERQKLADSSVQKRLLDKVEEIIDQVEADHRKQLETVLAPHWLYRQRRRNRRYGYFYVGDQGGGKTSSPFRKRQDLIEDRFDDFDVDDYDWMFPGQRGDSQ